VNTQNKNKFLLWGIKLCFLTWLFLFIPAAKATEYGLLISEVSPNVGGASNEFIELHNISDADLDLQAIGLKLKLISSSGTITNKTINWMNKIIPARSYFLFGAGIIPNSFDATYGGTLMTGTSGVMIMDKDDVVIDRISWINLATNVSLERYVGNFIPDNNAGFFIQAVPNPQNSSYKELPIEPDPVPEPTPISNPEPVIYSKEIRINEILPSPKSSLLKEFVEFYNFSDTAVNLSGWKLQDMNLIKNNKFCSLPELLIQPTSYAIFNLKDCDVSITLNNTGDSLSLFNPISSDPLSKTSFGKAEYDVSWSFSGVNWKWTCILTPGAENDFAGCEEDDSSDGSRAIDDKTYDAKIYLNEILPNAEEEFIEIYNFEKGDVDLSGWILRDASKTGKYIFPKDTVLKSEKYFVIYKKDYKFALNNSGEEKVYLQYPDEEEADSVAYDGSKKDVSYNFDGANWRWSKFLTPGQENKFNNIPETKIKKDKKIYTNMYADFDAKVFDADGDKIKVVWNFGDGRKSYKKTTRHKYAKEGKYQVTLKISDGSEDRIENFKIEVEDFPKIKMKITAISPNPKGNDSDLEWVEIKNESKKKVNLKDWSVATGWKNLYNHPIKEDFIINPGKTKILTREYSAFALNNKKGKIELRYPDGEVADKLKYDKKKESVADDEVYRKVKKKKWGWEKEKTTIIEVDVQENTQTSEVPEVANNEVDATSPIVESNPAIIDNEAEGENNAIDIENEINNDQVFLDIKNENALALSPVDIIKSNPFIQGKVLGVEIMKNNNQQYEMENKNSIEWSHSLFLKINRAINRIISLI